MSKAKKTDSKVDPSSSKAAQQELAAAAQKKKVLVKELGLSFPISGRGFNMAPEGFIVANDIFDILFERFDQEMLKKKVEREYKHYSI